MLQIIVAIQFLVCFVLPWLGFCFEVHQSFICAYFVSIVFLDKGRKLRMYECEDIEKDKIFLGWG